MAVILLDLSTETVLNAIITSVDSSKTPSDGFPNLLNQIEPMLTKKTLGGIPDRANILLVHNIRNRAQHEARYPNSDEVSDCRTYTRDFLKKIVKQVWRLNFEHISLADFIQNKIIRNILKDAEKALEEEDIQSAINESVIGLEKALSDVDRALTGKLTWSSSDAILTTDGDDGFEINNNITDSFQKMRYTLHIRKYA